jgi:hypothetical protein
VRIVGAIEGKISEERAGVFFFEKGNRLLSKDLTGMLGADFSRCHCTIFQAAKRGFKRIGHAASKKASGLLETQWHGLGRVVPFTANESGVSGPSKGRRPSFVTAELFVNAEQGTPRKQHGTGRNAGRRLHAPLHVGAIEGQATLYQSIKVRCLNDCIA